MLAMKFQLSAIGLALVLLPSAFLLPGIHLRPLPASDATPSTKAFLTKHCIQCHGPTKPKGEFRVDTLPANPDASERWKAAFNRVKAGEMPPRSKPQPTAAEKSAFLAQVQVGLSSEEIERRKREGRVVLRRLNRIEYENTIRDLLGVSVDVREMLPEDTLSHGFDTVAEALTLSPVHLEKYLEAGRKALEMGIIKTPKPEAKKSMHALSEREKSATGFRIRTLDDGSQATFSSGGQNFLPIADQFRVSRSGNYRISIRGQAIQTKSPVAFALYQYGGGAFGNSEILGYDEFLPEQCKTFTYMTWLDRNESFRIHPTGLPLGFYNEKQHGPVEKYKGPGIAVSSIEIEGPLFDTWPPRGQKLLFSALPLQAPKGGFQPKGKGANNTLIMPGEYLSKDPKADAETGLRAFASAAFRRPVDKAKLRPYLDLFETQRKEGANFEEAMLTAAVAILCSPDFLFLIERPGQLDDFALASRLSYFLTRSMPDEELLKHAAARKLTDRATLRDQTERLLNKPTAKRFHADFVDSWLDLRNIAFTVPDRILYPEFDRLLEYSIVQETRLFFANVLNENESVTNFIDSNYAMLNQRLATHYNIPGVEGVQFRKVPLKPEYHRGGVLTHASVMKVSANGTSTSPVVRGVYVLERILGQTPPPPPPGVPAVEPDIRGAKTVRELLAKHRDNDNCAGCHRTIDPPGFALESFDVIGGWREKFRIIPEKGPRKYKEGLPVDASGEWPDGRKFKGFDEFRKQLLADPERFASTLTKKLLTFGTGQEPSIADAAEIKRIASENVRRKQGFRDLVHAVVQSEMFLKK
jgi:hypothetical protein